jgi:glycosyltransferase involved in cell wall biosynthesis
VNILLDHENPFLLAHGGFQIQIEQTKTALDALGVHVEFLRWWDDSQKADVIHYFGRPQPSYIAAAHAKNIRVVIAPLLTGLGSRSHGLLIAEKNLIAVGRRMLPGILTAPFRWDAFNLADGTIALTGWESHLMRYVFDAPFDRIHVIPNGVEDIFLESAQKDRGPWLVCTATITARKRVVEMCEAAVVAKTPLWVVGKPYSEGDTYAQAFLNLTLRHPDIIRFEGAIQDRAKLSEVYRSARGFVLLSTQESLSLSALEAAACGCPLLLSDLPWARTVFKEHASYCPVTGPARTAETLRRFYDTAPTLPVPSKPLSWLDVGKQIRNVYEHVLKTSR